MVNKHLRDLREGVIPVNESKDLQRFVESYSFNNKSIHIIQGVELRESINKCSYKLQETLQESPSEGFWLPISFYGKVNGNGRLYNKRLWENVLDNQKDIWKGSPMLEDHPAGDSDGNPRDICGVWIDAKMDEPDEDGIGLVWGLLIPSGRLGEDLSDHLRKGLKVGTSSSGFGKLMKDGKTVDPDTYQIERLADFVLNPSQNTWAVWERDTDSIVDRSIKESQELNKKQESNTKESTVKDSKIAKLEEKKFRRDMESFLESANNIKDPQERLEEFKEIRSYLEDGACPDLKEKIESKIAEEEAYIKQAIHEKMELQEEMDISSPQDLREKLTQMTEDVKIIESESQNWKAISEKLQLKYNEAKKALKSRPSEGYLTFLEKKNDYLYNQLLEQNKKAADMVTKMIEAYSKLKEENAKLEDQVEGFENDQEEVASDLQESEAYKEAAIKADSLNRKSYEALEKRYQEATENIAKLTKVVENQRARIEEASKKVESLSRLSERRAHSIHQLMKENRKYSESLKNHHLVMPLSETEKYYETLYNTYGSQVEPFKEKITKAVNLAQAKQIFYKDALQNMKESVEIQDLSIPESMYVTPAERQNALGLNSIKKSNMMDRRPQGWV